jgi:hypothetical protein
VPYTSIADFQGQYSFFPVGRCSPAAAAQMFYKPKFCCHCGEKIERADWRLWTSRRFCEFCETEFKGEQLFKSAAAAACLLIGALGMAGLFRQPQAPLTEASAVPNNVSRPAAFAPSVPAKTDMRNERPAEAVSDIGNETGGRPPGSDNDQINVSPKSEQPSRAKKSSDKPAYYCGATTKKGTPCSRRVRSSGIRCWQHEDAN